MDVSVKCRSCGGYSVSDVVDVRWVERKKDGETWNVLQKCLKCQHCGEHKWHDVEMEEE